jgi:hypothetical protein
MHLHDSPTSFRIQLHDELSGRDVLELEHAWRTAQSILDGKELVIDLSKLASAGDDGVRLLLRMKADGARFLAPNSELSAALSLPLESKSRPKPRTARWFGRRVDEGCEGA